MSNIRLSPKSLTEMSEKEQQTFVKNWLEPFGSGVTNEDEDFYQGSFKYVYANCQSFEKALEPQYKIIIGRRGSGKTALIKYIKLFSDYDIKILCNKYKLIEWINNNVNGSSNNLPIENYIEQCKKYFWKLTFEEISNINESRDIDIFLKKGKQTIQKIWFGIIKWSEENQKSKSWIQGLISNIIMQFTVDNNKKFEQARKEAKEELQNKRVIILIDSLEEYEYNDENLRKIFSSILMAAATFENEEIFSIKCFFPSEYYSSLKDNSTNWGKISRATTFLRWNSDELLIMLCKRLGFYLYCNNKNDIKSLDIYNNVSSCFDLWFKYFPKEVTNSIFNIRESSLVYILRHTQMSPRQAIKLCNQVSNLSRNYLLNNSITEKVTEKMIQERIEEEEKSLSIEVFTSFRNIYPKAEEFCDEYLKCLPMRFEYNKLRECYEEIIDKINNDKQNEYNLYTNFRTFRRMLYELGIVGKEDTSFNHPKYHVVIFEPNEDFQINIGDNEYVCVHPMFIRKIRFTRELNICSKPICSKLLI